MGRRRPRELRPGLPRPRRRVRFECRARIDDEFADVLPPRRSERRAPPARLRAAAALGRGPQLEAFFGACWTRSCARRTRGRLVGWSAARGQDYPRCTAHVEFVEERCGAAPRACEVAARVDDDVLGLGVSPAPSSARRGGTRLSHRRPGLYYQRRCCAGVWRRVCAALLERRSCPGSLTSATPTRRTGPWRPRIP